MITFPRQFVATKYPGYFWNTTTHKLYTLKISGVLREMKITTPSKFNGLRCPSYRVSVEGYRCNLYLTELMTLKSFDSEIPAEIVEQMSLFDAVKAASRKVDHVHPRTRGDVIISALTELGECAEEVRIANGTSYKPQGVDGVVGEAIDTIACMIDLIHVENPELTERELVEYALTKMKKWVKKEKKHAK
jgi:hypothetical protein